MHFFGKIQDWIFELDYKDSFLRKKRKIQKGFFRVIFLTPHDLRASLRAKSKMAASLFMSQLFNEVSNADFQIYDQLVYRSSYEEVKPPLKATCSNRVEHFIISNFSRWLTITMLENLVSERDRLKRWGSISYWPYGYTWKYRIFAFYRWSIWWVRSVYRVYRRVCRVNATRLKDVFIEFPAGQAAVLAPRPLATCTFFRIFSERDARIKNPKNMNSGSIHWILVECGFLGFIIPFWIFPKKRKIPVWIQNPNSDFYQRSAPFV